MKKISYLSLQKKYPQKIVALNKTETAVLGAGKEAYLLVSKLEKQGINPKEIVLVGPIQKQGTINVYLSPLTTSDYEPSLPLFKIIRPISFTCFLGKMQMANPACFKIFSNW